MMTHFSADMVRKVVDAWRHTGCVALTARAFAISEADVRAIVRIWRLECSYSAAADVGRAA